MSVDVALRVLTDVRIASEEEVAAACSFLVSRAMIPYRGRMGTDWEDEVQELTVKLFLRCISDNPPTLQDRYVNVAARNSFLKWCNRQSRVKNDVAIASLPEATIAQWIQEIALVEPTVLSQVDAERHLYALRDVLTYSEMQVLLYVECLGWTVAETARALSRPDSSVRSTRERVLRKLEQYREQEERVRSRT